MTGHLQSTAASALTTKPPKSKKNNQGGLQNWSGRFVEGINFLPQSGTEPRFLEFSVRRQVITPPILYRLPRREIIIKWILEEQRGMASDVLIWCRIGKHPTLANNAMGLRMPLNAANF